MIEAKLYKKIVELVPILCVDVILIYKSKFVLVKRKDEPLKGRWWIVGGRALKDEKTLDTAKRKVLAEIGGTARNFKRIGIYEDSYMKSAWGVPTSSVSVVYLAELMNLNVTPDKTISAIKLFDELPKRFLRNFND